jgi:carbon-monoxide dehydrogenase medium subunit
VGDALTLGGAMIPASFKYAAPTSIQEALAILASGDGEAKVLAGGHSLLPLMKLRLAAPTVLVDVNRIPGLSYLREDEQIERLRVGACTRYVEIERSELARQRYPLLFDTAGGIGDPQVRNRGTIGGSVAHGDPASDWPAVALAADAEVVVVGSAGERVVAARDFFLDTFVTDLAPGELVTEVRFPLPGPSAGGAYEKLHRKVGDWAVVGVAVQVALDADGNVERAGIGLCNVGPNSIKATAAEAFLVGKPLVPDNVNEAARLAMDASEPVADDRGPADYKRAMVQELTKRALRRAMARCAGGVA